MKKAALILTLLIFIPALYATKLAVDNTNTFQLEENAFPGMTCVINEADRTVTCASITPGTIQRIEHITALPRPPRDRSRIIGTYRKQFKGRPATYYVRARTQVR